MIKLPDVKLEDSIVYLDFEGVLCKNPITFYLLAKRPAKAIKALLNAIPSSIKKKLRGYNFIPSLIEETKLNYEKTLSEVEKYLLGREIYQTQSSTQKIWLRDLLFILRENSCETYIITNASKEIVYGFFHSLSSLVEKERILTSKEKDKAVKLLREKKKKIIGVGDSKSDEKAFEACDISIKISSIMSLLYPPKNYNYEFKNLCELLEFFDAVKTQQELKYLISP
jgi:2-hydroxy-3-keto-5-methylthiopentenyl-1-phosphate phosphatase